MVISKAHCFFEQSGTFKKEFRKLGIAAEDYDILNDFGETDHVIDLFKEITRAYDGAESIFDDIELSDLIVAFFPCTRFEDQILLNFKGNNSGLKNWSEMQKLEYNLRLHRELSYLYEMVTKLAIICLRRGLKLIIENPYSSQHYLVRYWSLPSDFVDNDRTLRGDKFKKPTQYWFINCKPSYNVIFEPQIIHKEYKTIKYGNNKVERSMITPEYANRFIREFLL